ncbi:MAG: EAL domain-containing protein [Cocleimonas sp.]
MKASDTLDIVLIQHELLMATGKSLDVTLMLEKFSNIAIKALNVPSIHIILKKNKEFGSEDQIISYPNITDSEYHVFDSSFMSIPDKTSFADCISANNMHSYIYSIKDIGYIIFERYKTKLHDNLAQALIPIIERLGSACFSCYQHKQMVSNNQKKEISEIKLRLEKSKLQTTLNAISNGVVTLTREFEILYMNPKAKSFLEISGTDYKDQNIRDLLTLYDTEDNKDITDIFFNYLQIKGKWKNIMPLVLKTNNGTKLSIEVNAKGVINNSGDVSTYVVVIQDVTHTLEIENELKWQATHDPLTQLFNRRGFEAHMQKMVYRNNVSSHVLLYLDLDRFKIVNDVCGHQAGDLLLQQVSELMGNEIRSTDVLSRLGGDEFGIILHDCSLDYALNLAEIIKQKVAKFRFSWEQSLFNIGVSIGVRNIEKLNTDVDLIMSDADMACYAAKENGRNQVYLADDNKIGEIAKKTNTNFIGLVNSAIEKNRLVLYGQIIEPLNDDGTNKPHIEVLLRMIDNGRVIPPDAFLPIAERYGKIREIDLWVISKAFEYLKTNKGFQININLSGVTLSDTSALASIIEIVELNRNNASRICFEITETAIITNLEKCISFIDQLNILGCVFALDDFGSGLSSFSYLKSLPVKYLKIDGSFIKDICNNDTDEIVVSSIHQTAKALSILTVAEYVSNDEIYDTVKKIGIDFVQGYKIGKPKILSDIIAETV